MKTILVPCLAMTILVASALYSQEEKKDYQVQNFRKQYPGELSIQWDKSSGGPKRIMGSNIYLKSRSIIKSNLHRLTSEFLGEHRELFNIEGTELVLENITELENTYVITYEQVYQNVPLWNVKLKLKIADNGQVLMIKSPCYANPNIATVPKLGSDEAKAIAGLSLGVSAEKASDGELVIYPERKTGKLFLCWHMKINSDGINKGVMIDAQTGMKIIEYDLYRNQEIRGTVSTTTWSLPGQTYGTPDLTTACQDLQVNVIGVASVNTNSSGYYSITVPSSGNYAVTSILDGPHCWVTNVTGPEASYSNTASTSSDHNWTWQESDHYNEYFVFHYMNNAWHEFANKVAGFSSNYWYSQKMEGRANDDFDPGNVNGRASGTWMGITPANHYGGAVYHEYSHNVNYRANGYWLGDYRWGDGYAMDEGLADYYSCTFANDPIIYPFGRRLDQQMQYYPPGPPEDDQHEAHTRGQIIGGACWDLQSKSGMSANYVNELVYESITSIGYEETFADFMDEMLSANDDDGNIFNGTPHDDQICDAFVNDHHIIGNYLSGNIAANITIDRDVELIGDVYVTSGVTLTINSGVTVNFTGSYKLQVNGALTILGSSGQHVIFDGQGYSRASMDNAMIVVQSGGTANIQYADFRNAAYELTCWQNSGAATVQNCTFTNFGYTSDSKAVSAYYSTGAVNISNSSFTGSGLNGIGVYATNTGTNVTISGNTFTTCRIGIRCYSSNAFITSNTIENSGYYGIQSDNVTTAAQYRSNTIRNSVYSSYGMYLNSSSPWLMYNIVTQTRVMVNSGAPNFATLETEGDELRGHNTIANGGAILLRAQNYATPYLGYGVGGGYNSLYGIDLVHMYVENHSGVYADNNYWGEEGPVNYIDGTSWVLARNPLSYNPNPLPKASFTSSLTGTNQSSTTQDEEDEEQFRQAVDAGYRREFVKAKGILLSLIEKNSDSKYPPLAVLMYYEFNRMELRQGKSGRPSQTIEEELINFLTNLKNKVKTDRLRPFGLRLFAREAGFAREFARMSDYQAQIIQDYPNSVHELTSLYDKIAYYVEIERDLESAKELLARMIAAYPKDRMTAFARILVGENVDLKEFEKQNQAELAKEQLPTQIHLGPAVPNPFNPTTTISFELPAETQVYLAVYDVLGHEVVQLVNEKKPAGKHAVVFNGAGLASGLYFYRFEVDGFTAVRKMTLTK